MAKSRLSSVALAMFSAGLLGACDTDAEDAAQESESAAAQSPADLLTGTLLRDFEGEQVPDVIVSNPEGAELALRGLGQPVLMNLWATWCAPCVVEMPMLDALAADLDGQVQVLTISEDLRGAEVVEPFFAENDLPNLTQWMDVENELAFAFEGGVLPLTVLYDADGREVWRVVGAYDWTSENARDLVLEISGSDSPARNSP